MSIRADQIINIYGKKYFDKLYDETNQTHYDFKKLIKRDDFSAEMAMKLPVGPTILFFEAYYTHNEKLLKKIKTLKLDRAALFNRVLVRDDIELLKIMDSVKMVPKKFSASYSVSVGDRTEWHLTSRRRVSETFSILDLVKHFRAKKCYKFMKETMKFKKYLVTYPIKNRNCNYHLLREISDEGFLL